MGKCSQTNMRSQNDGNNILRKFGMRKNPRSVMEDGTINQAMTQEVTREAEKTRKGSVEDEK
jgi:hypothetical protein